MGAQRTQQCARLLEEWLESVPASTIDRSVAANLLESMLSTLYQWYDPEGSVGPEELVDQIMELAKGVDPSA